MAALDTNVVEVDNGLDRMVGEDVEGSTHENLGLEFD